MYNDDEFRNFDSLITNTFPSIEKTLKKNLLGQIIKYWRTSKPFPLYIQLYIYIKKRNS